MKKSTKPRKRRVIYIEAYESRLWVYALIKDRAKKSGNSMAEEAFGILAAYLIKSHAPDEVMRFKKEYPAKKQKGGKSYPRWRF